MAINVIQETKNQLSVAGSTLDVAFSSNITAKSSIWVVVPMNRGWSGLSTAPTDTLGNSYSLIGNLDNSVVGNRMVHYWADSTNGGANTVHLNLGTGNNATNWLGLIFEIGQTGGYDSGATGPSQGGTAYTTSNLGTGTDACTTGNFTASVQPGLIVVCGMLDTTSVTTGTGFTGPGQNFVGSGGIGNEFYTENKRYTSTTVAGSMTITSGTTHNASIIAALFKEGQIVNLTLTGQKAYFINPV